jgi:hypothetical protein
MVKQEIHQDENLDEYLEKLLDVQRKKTKKLEKQFQENNEGWKKFKFHNDENLKELVDNPKYQDNLNEIRRINKDSKPLAEDKEGSPTKVTPPVEIKFAEEEMLRKFEEDEQIRIQQEEQDKIREEEERKERILMASAKKSDNLTDSINFDQSNVEAEFKLELERMYMEREDKLSMQFNQMIHKAKFAQKDVVPPQLPELKGLQNVPVQKNQPLAPM